MKTILSVILSFISVISFSQEIIIQPPMISPFECTEFYKLYTGMVNNFSSETFNTKLLLEVDYTSPSGNSQRLADGILSGNPSVDFGPGTTTNINNATYESIYTNRNITFYDKDIENLLSRTKCLPPGQYDVCLTLMDAKASDGSTEFLTQTCYTREKQMLSNLLLVSPFEGDEVAIDMPLFTWTPVTPINPGAMYRIQIVEMLANQTPFEAFRSNPVFYERSGLMSNIFQYPVSARTMLPCTQYAWRVTYELAGGFVSTAFQKAPDFLQESEIWEFSKPCVEEEEEEEEMIDVNSPFDKYHNVNNFSKSSIITVTDYQLRLLIDNTYSSKKTFSYIVINQNGTSTEYACCWDCCGEVESSDDDTRTERRAYDNRKNIDAGIQKLKIDLDELGLNPNEVYTIRIDSGKESKDIKFKIIL